MVFSKLIQWFSGAKEEVAEVEPSKISLALEEVEGFLREKNELKIKSSLSSSISLCKETESIISELTNVLGELKDQDIGTDVDPRLAKTIADSTLHLHTKILTVLRRMDMKCPHDLESVLDFRRKLKDTISLVSSAYNTHARYIAIVFDKETEAVWDLIKNLINVQEEIEVQLMSLRIVQVLDEVGELKSTILTNKEAIEELNIEIEKKNKKKTSIVKSLDSINSDIDSINDELNPLKKEISKIERDIKTIKQQINQDISTIRKALDKFIKISSTDGAKQYFDSFYQNLIDDGQEHPQLTKILNDLKKAINNGSISLKDKMKKKTLARIDNILSGKLKKQIVSLIDLKANFNEKKSKFNSNSKNKQLKKHIAKKNKLKKEKDGIEQSILLQKKTLNNLEQDVKKRIKELVTLSTQSIDDDVVIIIKE